MNELQEELLELHCDLINYSQQYYIEQVHLHKLGYPPCGVYEESEESK